MGWDLGLWILMCVIIIVWGLKMRMKSKNYRKNGKLMIPKGSMGWPLLGETLDFISCGYSPRPVSFMDKRKRLYGKVFQSHLLGRPIIISTDPEVNKVVLQNQGNVFIPYYPKSITELLGKSSILQMNGSLQRRVHALVGGFLRSPLVKARLAHDIEKCVKLTLSTWEHQRMVYLQDEVKKITFEVLVKVLMSVGPGEDMKFLKDEYAEFIKGLICFPFKFPGSTLYKSLKAKKRLLEKVERIVKDRRVGVDKDKAKDVVDVLLNDPGESNDSNRLPLNFICGNIIEMMIPGEDTVPMVMTLAVKFISDNPATLSHLMEENMILKSRKAQSGDDYTWTDYMSLQFTQNVINETLRMANIINAVWRKTLKDVEIRGYLIPKDWCVITSFSSIHMDEENYEDPYHFNPWRWEKTEGGINSNVFTPFGGGQRLCPGLELSRLEISIFLHHLVTTYRWEADPDEIINFPTVKMKKKLPITVMPIKSQP